jgi:hypothetical protein
MLGDAREVNQKFDSALRYPNIRSHRLWTPNADKSYGESTINDRWLDRVKGRDLRELDAKGEGIQCEGQPIRMG